MIAGILTVVVLLSIWAILGLYNNSKNEQNKKRKKSFPKN